MTLVCPSEECLASVFKEYETSDVQVDEDVKVLKSWLHMQPHLPHIEDDKILKHMLVRCKCSMERAKQALDMHFTLKTALPEFFTARDPLSPEMQNGMNAMEMVPLPTVTKEGYRVTFYKVLQSDAALFQPEMLFKLGLMIADIRLKEDSSVGDVFIYDCEKLGIGHISKMSLPMLKKMEVCASQGYRARIKGVHFINAPPVIDVLMTMVKRVVKTKLASRHHVHANLDSLYEHLDRDMLPEEYGGKAGKIGDLAAAWKKKSEDMRDWFIEQENVGKADESKREDKSFIDTNDLFGFEGTFKQLTVD